MSATSMKTMTDAQIGLAVKIARQATNWTGKDLSDGSGLSPSAISKIESGKQKLAFSEAVQIAGALGIQVDQLASLAMDAGSLAENTERARDQLKRGLQKLGQRVDLGAQTDPRHLPGSRQARAKSDQSHTLDSETLRLADVALRESKGSAIPTDWMSAALAVCRAVKDGRTHS